MWAVLTKLELTSNGATASFDADSGGGSARHHSDTIPRLGRHDAPHLFYAVEYDRARTEDELRAITHSRADRAKEETKDQRDQRLVDEGEGFEAIEVARSFNCGVRDVHRAREAAGRDTEWGKAPVNGRELTAEQRVARAREMADRGMTAKQIAFALGRSYNTVRRDLGRLD
jgi:hypothetical protein